MSELKINIESEVLYFEVHAVVGVKVNGKVRDETHKVEIGHFKTIKAIEDALSEREGKNASI